MKELTCADSCFSAQSWGERNFLIGSHWIEVSTMPTAPHISVYELIHGEPSREMEALCAPDGFYALAAAMTYIESTFLAVENKELQPIVKGYKNITAKGPEEAFAPLDWYFKTCEECAIITEDKEWIARREDFSKSVLIYLLFLIFHGQEINQSNARGHRLILQLFARLIGDEIKDWDVPFPLLVRITKIALFPVRPLLRRLIPRAARDMKKEKMQQGLEVLQRLLRYLESAMNEKRVFTFEKPADQTEKQVSLGGLNIGIDRQGRINFGEG
jgi:hypothetical protein